MQRSSSSRSRTGGFQLASRSTRVTHRARASRATSPSACGSERVSSARGGRDGEGLPPDRACGADASRFTADLTVSPWTPQEPVDPVGAARVWGWRARRASRLTCAPRRRPCSQAPEWSPPPTRRRSRIGRGGPHGPRPPHRAQSTRIPTAPYPHLPRIPSTVSRQHGAPAWRPCPSPTPRNGAAAHRRAGRQFVPKKLALHERRRAVTLKGHRPPEPRRAPRRRL